MPEFQLGDEMDGGSLWGVGGPPRTVARLPRSLAVPWSQGVGARRAVAAMRTTFSFFFKIVMKVIQIKQGRKHAVRSTSLYPLPMTRRGNWIIWEPLLWGSRGPRGSNPVTSCPDGHWGQVRFLSGQSFFSWCSFLSYLFILFTLMESTLTFEKVRTRSVFSLLSFIQRADSPFLCTHSSCAAKEEAQVLLVWISALLLLAA